MKIIGVIKAILLDVWEGLITHRTMEKINMEVFTRYENDDTACTFRPLFKD